jgi:hypothetical protein
MYHNNLTILVNTFQASQRADQEQKLAEEARVEAHRERQRAELLSAKLRELGIDL